MPVRLSILLPVYNAGPYLAAQLSSILAQDDGDFELLAIDDGSTDDSAAQLFDAARHDSRVRLIPAHGNLGQRTRLRELLAHASGHFVAIADQDDIWHHDRNRLLLAAIGDRPLAFGPSSLIDADGAPLGGTLLDRLGLTPDPAMALRSLFKPMVSAHAMIVRRDWIDPAIFGHPMPFDWLAGTAALHGGGIAYVDAAVVEHRLHGANQMNRDGPDSRRRLAALRNRYAFLLRAPMQLRLWLMLDFLGTSAMVSHDRRRLFAELAAACRHSWYGTPQLALEDKALRQLLRDSLRPLAGSAEDWAIAERQIDLVTRRLAHPAKLTEALRRLRTPLEAEF
ncbi:glycosyltransferase involved in cell wall biosynthesis [Sphingomonas jinjuensis]|uniref:Glycosyltransferase involved in cell wall biosynthesis n=1 Tax=Sphingomonas jinjuensis TaxID=535907 RepID=A0A840F923_9SPHN|nr:glycosyltransferase [Sphingomonas jinjuensis]MBB4154470.1 glycosyltransferase involved in cell wall biosynthesis [Sphingomonas jinjuensis]